MTHTEVFQKAFPFPLNVHNLRKMPNQLTRILFYKLVLFKAFHDELIKNT